MPSNQVSFFATANATLAMSATQNPVNENLQLTVTDSVGQMDNIYVSSDLQSRTLLATAVNQTGTVVVNDPDVAAVNQRFYRVTDSTATSDPVGFIVLPIAGAPSGEAQAFSYLGLSLLNPVSYQGTITSFGNYSVTDENASWTATIVVDGTGIRPLLLAISGPPVPVDGEIMVGYFAGLSDSQIEANQADPAFLESTFVPFGAGGTVGEGTGKLRRRRTIEQLLVFLQERPTAVSLSSRGMICTIPQAES